MVERRVEGLSRDQITIRSPQAVADLAIVTEYIDKRRRAAGFMEGVAMAEAVRRAIGYLAEDIRSGRVEKKEAGR